MTNEKYVKNYYQGIYLTETILGNPNGDFIDNSPRNFDGNIFTTDKCIKYNVRKYIHDNYEEFGNGKCENIVFCFPRLADDSNEGDMKFKTRTDVYKYLLNDFDDKDKFEELKKRSPDIRMFGGTLTLQGKGMDSYQIYGPIQLSYGIDINNAQIIRDNIASPFADKDAQQKTIGSFAVVDDAIISYDISINPNNHKNLLLENDLSLFKESLWFGTNSRMTTSKNTKSILIILIKFKNDSEDKVKAFNIGELNQLITIKNKNDDKINLDGSNLKEKLCEYYDFIESIEIISDKSKVSLNNFFSESNGDKKFKVIDISPIELIGN